MIVEAWTAIAAVGALAGAWGVIEALRDRSALRELQRNGTDLLIAHQRLFAQTVRCGISTAWMLIGVGLISEGVRVDELTLTTAVLMGSNLALTVLAVRDIEIGYILRRHHGGD